MTPDQEQAREREAQHLAKLLAELTPLADPLTYARKYWQGLTEDRYWRWWPPDPGITKGGPKDPDAYDRGGALARDLLNIRKDSTDA